MSTITVVMTITLLSLLLGSFVTVVNGLVDVQLHFKGFTCQSLFTCCCSDAVNRQVNFLVTFQRNGKRVGQTESFRQPWNVGSTASITFDQSYWATMHLTTFTTDRGEILSFSSTAIADGCKTVVMNISDEIKVFPGLSDSHRPVDPSVSCYLDYSYNSSCAADYYGANCDLYCKQGVGDFSCTKTGAKICNQNYYQPETNCTTYCRPYELGNYTCHGISGAKICDENFFGPLCSAKCVPNPGRHTCDPQNGERVCLEDFYGHNCYNYCRETNRYSCEKATGARVCYRNWYGPDCDIFCFPGETDHFTCDETVGAKICLPGWYGKNCEQMWPSDYRTSFIVVTVLLVILILINVLAGLYWCFITGNGVTLREFPTIECPPFRRNKSALKSPKSPTGQRMSIEELKASIRKIESVSPATANLPSIPTVMTSVDNNNAYVRGPLRDVSKQPDVVTAATEPKSTDNHRPPVNHVYESPQLQSTLHHRAVQFLQQPEMFEDTGSFSDLSEIHSDCDDSVYGVGMVERQKMELLEQKFLDLTEENGSHKSSDTVSGSKHSLSA